MKQYIYADNAATTKLDIDAYEAMRPYLLESYGNASQPYSFARSPKKAIKEAREIIAKCIGATPEEIIFTSGGTESDNWAIKCVDGMTVDRKTIITSEIEHHAVLNACRSMELSGTPVAYLPANKCGRVLPETLTNYITTGTRLVSVMFSNNEVGTIQPVQELCEIAHQYGALFHTDAVQAIGHIPIDVKATGVDLLSASAHKFNGPKGIGFLYIKKGTPIKAYHNGGSQEFGLRSGTENVASIVAMAVALMKNCEHMQENQRYIAELENQLIQGLDGVDYIRNGDPNNHLPGNISLSFRGRDGEAILHRMDLKGIIISTGSACDSMQTQISHVLNAIHVPDNYAPGTIRISLGRSNTKEEITKIVEALKDILAR